MRLAKKIALWTLGTLLSTVTAAVIFLSLADDDFYRWAMRQAIEGATDREVRVDGTFSFDLGWQPTLIVTDIWIENAAWTGKKEMARAKRVEVQVDLKPLFSGILRLPRLVVDGLDLDLEVSADKERNWEMAAPRKGGDRAPDPEAWVYPLIDTISLSNISVTHRDHKSGRETELRLHFMKKLDQPAGDAPYEIRGEASLNQHEFTIAARVGTVEDAIAALKPYPVDVTLQSEHLLVKLSGTVEDVPNGHGLDLNLLLRTPSVFEVLQAFGIENESFGPGLASTHLKGDLASLAAEDIQVAIIAPSGEELKVEGRIANLMRGDGLDIRLDGKVNPAILELIDELPPGAAGLVDGLTEIGAKGHLTGNFQRPALKDAKLHIEHISGAEISLDGGVTADLSGKDISLADFQATAQAYLPDQVLLAQALGVLIPDLRDINATADLAWTGDWITLRSASVTGKAWKDVSLKGEGRLGRLSRTDLAFDLDVQLDLTGSSASSQPLIYLVEGFSPSMWKLPEAAAGRAPASLAESARAGSNLVLRIQRELLAVGSSPGVLDGRMGPATRAAIEDYQRREGLTVDGRASDELLQHLQQTASTAASAAPNAGPQPVFEFSDSLPELGPIAASIRFLFKDDIFRFENLDLTIGTNGTKIHTAGVLGQLSDRPDGLLTKIDVAVSFTAPSTQRFAELLPPETPAFRQIAGRFKAKGTENLIAISEAEITAEGPVGLMAAVTGEVGEVSLEDDPEARKVALVLDARWPDTQSVYDFVDQNLPQVKLPDLDLPELGPVAARATLKDRDGTFALSGLTATAGAAEQPKLRVTGDIADLPALRGIELVGDVDVATTVLLKQFAEASDGDLGRVRGRFELSDRDGSFGIKVLSAGLEDTALLSLDVDGVFGDLTHGDALRLSTRLIVPDFAALGRKLDFDAQDLGRLTFDGVLSGSNESFTAEGTAKFGETDITGNLTGTLQGERPALQGKIHSPLFRLADVGLVPRNGGEQDDQEAAPQETTPPPKQEWIFGEAPIPFDALKSIDLDIDVVLEDVEGVHLDIDKIDTKVVVTDGKLKVDPLTFDFVGGNAEVTLLADASGDRPQVHLEISANNVNLENLLSQAKVEVPLDGTMDFVADLTAQGQSARDLVSTLNGNTELAIADGHVLTGLLTLTTTNPVSWMFTKSARKGYSKMNCLIMRFDMKDGLARSNALLLDTPNMQAVGKGQIDFRNETLQIDVSPQAKERRLIAMSTPFSIDGSLAAPSIGLSAVGASLRTGGELLLSPLTLLGSLLPFVGNGADKDNPCLNLKAAAPSE